MFKLNFKRSTDSQAGTYIIAVFYFAVKAVRCGDPAADTYMWQADSKNLRQELRVSPDSKPWTARAEFKGTGLPKTARVLDLLDLFVISRCQRLGVSLSNADMKAAMSGQFIDVSQSLLRCSYTNRNGINHALTTGSMLYSFDRDSVLTGKELLLLHGQPKSLELPAGATEAQIGHLAGEGMACPCLAVVLWSIYLAKQFPE